MPKRKSNTTLPPQFSRAKQQAEKKKQPKKAPAKTQKQSPTFLENIKQLLGLSPKKVAVTKKTKPKVATKKTPSKTPKKRTKKTSSKRQGVIAKKAAQEHKKKTKKAPSKAKKKAKKPAAKKATVQKPAAKKAKAPVVEFEQIDIDLTPEPEVKKRERQLPEITVVPKRIEGEEDVNEAKPPTVKRRKATTERKKWFWLFGKKKATPKKAPLAEKPQGKGAIEAISEGADEDGPEITAVIEEKAEEPTPEIEVSDATEAEVEAQIAELETQMKAAKAASKKEARSTKRQRAQELKELRKKAKELAKEMQAEVDVKAEQEAQQRKMLEVDQRIAEKKAEKLQKEQQLEDQERRKAQANKDLDAMAEQMVNKKKKTRGGFTGFMKSINNMGMGKYRVQFVQNLAMMLNAGLPLIDAIKTLELEIRNRAMRKVIARIGELVDSGYPLWRAMDEQYLFTPYEIALVRVGEEAGNLSRNMVYLAEQQEKDHALKQKVKMAMIYPSIVMVLMFIVVMGLGLFVLPNLVQVLYSLNADLPATTRAVIFVTELFSKYGKQAVPAMLGVAIILVLLAKYTAFRRVSQWFIFKIPGIGRLAREATIARFGVILGGLLEAGVPLVESLQSLEEVTTIVCYKKMYHQMTERVALGDSFALCFKDIKNSKKLIPGSMQQLIITGERSGSLSETFLKVANIYEKKAEETAEKLPTILEPMLLLFIGGLVGTIAFAIITPIYSVVGNVGR